jgi:hypothetical protein
MLDTAQSNIRDAIAEYIAAQNDEGDPVPAERFDAMIVAI